MNHLVFIKKQLYILKRQYGNPITLYSDLESIDLTTGIKVHTKVPYYIPKAIILPMNMVSQAIFNQAYMKNVGREYAYGNVLSLEIKNLIIDQRDIPSTYNITPDDFISIENNRFEVMKVIKLEKNLGYELIVKRSLGVPTGNIFNINVQQNIRFIERQLCQ